MKKYYKVLSFDRMSCSCAAKFAIVYKPLVWTKPNIENSKLFVFNSLEAAKDYVSGRQIIVSCYVKNPTKSNYRKRRMNIWDMEDMNEIYLSEFWKEVKSNSKNLKRFFSLSNEKWTDGNYLHNYAYDYPFTPLDTVFCDAVYCLE